MVESVRVGLPQCAEILALAAAHEIVAGLSERGDRRVKISQCVGATVLGEQPSAPYKPDVPDSEGGVGEGGQRLAEQFFRFLMPPGLAELVAEVTERAGQVGEVGGGVGLGELAADGDGFAGRRSSASSPRPVSPSRMARLLSDVARSGR